MRGYFLLVTVILIVPSSLSARSDEIPTLDIQPVCRGIASQSADPGIGQGGQAKTFQECIESEQRVHEQLQKVWASFSAADKQHCVTLAKTGGESSNTELLTCLEMARDVRALHSRAAPLSEGDKTPTSPTLQSAHPASASAPNPATEVPKGDEQTKQDALTTKASEALAQLKLADAETAVKSAKEEVSRARAEAEQAKAEAQQAKAEVQKAKADAQAAGDAEVSARRKLAAAEVALATAAEACPTPAKPDSAGRLREWFNAQALLKIKIPKCLEHGSLSHLGSRGSRSRNFPLSSPQPAQRNATSE